MTDFDPRKDAMDTYTEACKLARDGHDGVRGWLKGCRVIHGDMIEALPTLEANSIDACVTDPPYHLTSIVKRFGSANHGSEKYAAASNSAYMSRGFMGQTWDGGDIAFRPETWAEVFRVLKPGAHLVAFSGTRTYHRMVCAIEDAGFEIRDQLAWVYGSGFPKSHNVGKALDPRTDEEIAVGVPQPEESLQWQGWGTALKPSWEPIVLARKPLAERTIAANVLAHGCGAINVDACRVGTGEDKGQWPITQRRHEDKTYTLQPVSTDASKGRWPANLVHDGSPEVLAEFAKYAAPGQRGAVTGREPSRKTNNVYGAFNGRHATEPRGDHASPARFFYSAKADAGDRLSSKHPTVKPVDLMRWLVRMVTPSGGIVLDPFAGSGTTGMACIAEAKRCVMIEREAEYVADINRRIAHIGGEDTPLFQNSNQNDLFE